jgi:pyruvate-formate lyase-activating enzyme
MRIRAFAREVAEWLVEGADDDDIQKFFAEFRGVPVDEVIVDGNEIRIHNEKVEAIAVALQRQKTAMETSGLQERYWEAYQKVSEAIWSFEKNTGIDVPALRDQEDEQLGIS